MSDLELGLYIAFGLVLFVAAFGVLMFVLGDALLSKEETARTQLNADAQRNGLNPRS